MQIKDEPLLWCRSRFFTANIDIICKLRRKNSRLKNYKNSSQYRRVIKSSSEDWKMTNRSHSEKATDDTGAKKENR